MLHVAFRGDGPEPGGGWALRDERWLVAHGPAGASSAGSLEIASRRHYVDLADMTGEEATAFGSFLRRLDTSARSVTKADRVHLVCTRDCGAHFHAWL